MCREMERGSSSLGPTQWLICMKKWLVKIAIEVVLLHGCDNVSPRRVWCDLVAASCRYHRERKVSQLS